MINDQCFLLDAAILARSLCLLSIAKPGLALLQLRISSELFLRFREQTRNPVARRFDVLQEVAAAAADDAGPDAALQMVPRLLSDSLFALRNSHWN